MRRRGAIVVAGPERFARAVPGGVVDAHNGIGGDESHRFCGCLLSAGGRSAVRHLLPPIDADRTGPISDSRPTLLGSNGYCEKIAANGASIDGSFLVDTTKLNDVIFLGARWTRMPAPQFFVDLSHVFGAGNYAFGSLDAAQCISLTYHS